MTKFRMAFTVSIVSIISLFVNAEPIDTSSVESCVSSGLDRNTCTSLINNQRGSGTDGNWDEDDTIPSTVDRSGASGAGAAPQPSWKPPGTISNAKKSKGGFHDVKSEMASWEKEFNDLNSSANIQSKVDENLKKCVELNKDAIDYCNIIPPEMMAMLGVAANVGSAAASSTSVKSKCEAAQYVSSLGTGLNGGLAATCLLNANLCTSLGTIDSCGFVEKRAGDQAKADDVAYKENCPAVVAEYNSLFEMNEDVAQAKWKNGVEGKYKNCRSLQVSRNQNLATSKRARELAAECAGQKKNGYQYLAQAAATSLAVAQSTQCVNSAKDIDKLSGKYATGNSCDDPLKRQTPDCICKDPVQLQQNSLCINYRPGGSNPGGGYPPIAGAGAGAPGVNPLDDLKKPFGKVGGDGTGAQTRNEGMGGGSSGGPQAGNSGGLNPEENGGAAPEYNTNVDQGYQRSKGGLGEGSMFGSSKGGYGGAAGAEKKPGFDLSKYMPWAKKAGPDRQIAEINKLKAEGVTGANGPSIWEKVSNRMRAIRGRLE